MDIRKNKLYKLAILSGIILVCYGCPSPCSTEANYNFHASFNISPDLENVEIGDTIFFESIVPVQMQNTLDNVFVNFSGSTNFGSTLRLGRLEYTSDTLIDAVKSFDYYPIKGRIYTDNMLMPSRIKQLLYIEEGSSYLLKFGIIAKDTGVYTIAVSDAINVTRRKKNNCDRANIQITIDNLDKHLNYLQNIYYKSQPMAEADKSHSYCFVVK